MPDTTSNFAKRSGVFSNRSRFIVSLLGCILIFLGCVERLRPSMGCESDDDCASLETCESGTCVAQALVFHDGGRGGQDSGRPALVDAGITDGGSFSTTDAGPKDAGISDIDAGQTSEDSGTVFYDAGEKNDGGQTTADAGNAASDGGTLPDAGLNYDAGVVEPQLNIPPVGISRRVAGELFVGGAAFTRAAASCTAQTSLTGMLYATHVLKNNGDEVRLVTITGNWMAGDGFLFAYDTFDPAAPRQGCLVGSDDYSDNTLNSRDGSRITRLSVPPGEERVLVVTGFFNTFSGAYTLDIFGEHATEISYAALPPRGDFFYSTGTLHSNDAVATSFGTACDDVMSGDYYYDEILLHNQGTDTEFIKVFVNVPDEPIVTALLLNSGTCYKVNELRDGEAFRDFMNAEERLRIRLFSRLPTVRVGNWTVRVEVVE